MVFTCSHFPTTIKLFLTGWSSQPFRVRGVNAEVRIRLSHPPEWDEEQLRETFLKSQRRIISKWWKWASPLSNVKPSFTSIKENFTGRLINSLDISLKNIHITIVDDDISAVPYILEGLIDEFVISPPPPTDPRLSPLEIDAMQKQMYQSLWVRFYGLHIFYREPATPKLPNKKACYDFLRRFIDPITLECSIPELSDMWSQIWKATPERLQRTLLQQIREETGGVMPQTAAALRFADDELESLLSDIESNLAEEVHQREHLMKENPMSASPKVERGLPNKDVGEELTDIAAQEANSNPTGAVLTVKTPANKRKSPLQSRSPETVPFTGASPEHSESARTSIVPKVEFPENFHQMFQNEPSHGRAPLSRLLKKKRQRKKNQHYQRMLQHPSDDGEDFSLYDSDLHDFGQRAQASFDDEIEFDAVSFISMDSDTDDDGVRSGTPTIELKPYRTPTPKKTLKKKYGLHKEVSDKTQGNHSQRPRKGDKVHASPSTNKYFKKVFEVTGTHGRSHEVDSAVFDSTAVEDLLKDNPHAFKLTPDDGIESECIRVWEAMVPTT